MKDEEAKSYDIWAAVATRYGLRVVVPRSEIYKMAARDWTYAKMILPTFQQRDEIAAPDYITEAKDRLDSNMTTQPMKAVATPSARNATNRTGKVAPLGIISLHTPRTSILAWQKVSCSGIASAGLLGVSFL